MEPRLFNAEECKWWLEEINDGKFREYDPINGTFVTGIAVLEYDWIDIELNLSTESELDGDGYTDDLVPSYFCCVKGIADNGSAYWSDAGYLDDFGYDVDVDFSADDWMTQLKTDMEKKLAAFADRFALKYDEANWIGDGNDLNVFEQIYRLPDKR